MEVLHPTADLAPPNKCVICDETPKPSEQRVVDTGQSIIVPFTDVVGRKYVCEKCGLTIANRLGFVSNEQAKVAFHAAEAAAQRLAEVKEKVLSAAADIQSFATDVTLGNERSSLEKWVEGDFKNEIESTPNASSKPKAARKAGAASKSSSSTPTE